MPKFMNSVSVVLEEGEDGVKIFGNLRRWAENEYGGRLEVHNTEKDEEARPLVIVIVCLTEFEPLYWSSLIREIKQICGASSGAVKNLAQSTRGRVKSAFLIGC